MSTQWRSTEELLADPQELAAVRRAFPQLRAADLTIDRRGFARLLGASIALAGIGACSGPPPRHVVPRLRGLPGTDAAAPVFYATTLVSGNDVLGVLVETHEGRPTKIEGNPLHPRSLGGTNALAQAAVLELWDPDRSRAPRHDGMSAGWDDVDAMLADVAQRFGTNGRGLHVLSGALRSPTLVAQREALLARFPGARWFTYESVDDDHVLAGARLAFGRRVRMRAYLDRARVVLALDADFLGTLPGHVRHARDFIRGSADDAAQAHRLYALESTPSLTGAAADHRWALDPEPLQDAAIELARALGVDVPQAAQESGIPRSHIAALADDLRRNHGSALVLTGPAQPPFMHALAHLMNDALGSAGHALEYFDAPEENGAGERLERLLAAMDAGEVETLIVLDGNPVYSTPADAQFAARLKRIKQSIHLGLYQDETGAQCTWHVPRAHPLEHWSDLRDCDGTASLVQPVIEPLYGGRSEHALLARLIESSAAPISSLEVVRSTWRRAGLDDAGWERALHDGVIPGTAAPATSVRAGAASLSMPPRSGQTDAHAVTLAFQPDPTTWDGRYANNAWLQELPKPLTQLTWGNAALISPALAAELGVRNGDVLRVSHAAGTLQIPVCVLPGQATRTVGLALGHGRARAGHVGSGIGTDVSPLRTLAARWHVSGARLELAGAHVPLATTQLHHTMDEHLPVRSVTRAGLHASQTAAAAGTAAAPPASLYPDRPQGEYRWGMAIDLHSCIGCNACVVACQAENNIPVVGRDQVLRGRELHWLRVDRYFEGAPEAPRMHVQPVPCMHCEHAPCELACPVGATVHDSEGLNVQVYNRCIGTRFCANNCPYKVRRFNFLQYADLDTEALKAQRNPEVSVRNRGVMEKCTYCIQRIEAAHIAADEAGRRITDGEVVTACQGACPTRAIVFGDLSDRHSAVSQAKSSGRNYALLEELNTRPRTTYLAKVRNPNPAIGENT